MNFQYRRMPAVALLACSLTGPVSADDEPDYERETRIAEQIEPGIFDGEAVWLDANNRMFLGIYTAADQASGAVILLHGRDVNPEEQELIGPLRTGLPERGWSTLALQMPVLAKGSQYYDYLPILKYGHGRIESAIDYLREQGYTTIVLAAHSCGAHMANDWLNASGDSDIDGYVAMGLGATDEGQELKTPFPIADMRIPVLDIYGENEFDRPLALVEQRRQMLAENGNPHSAQVMVADTGHYFRGAGDEMVNNLSDWLDGIER